MKIPLISTALLVFGLSACVSHHLSAEELQKREAAKARVEVGIGYLQQGDAAQAKLNFDKALAHAPDYYLVHSALAYFHQQQGNTPAAAKSYLTAIKLDGKQGDVLNNYGAFLCSQGQYPQAYEQFNAALTAPGYYRQADTFENIALCALAEKNTALYQTSLAELAKLEPVRAEKLKNLSAGMQK